MWGKSTNNLKFKKAGISIEQIAKSFADNVCLGRPTVIMFNKLQFLLIFILPYNNLPKLI